MSTPAAPVHLHIGRLVVDAEALAPGGVPQDVAAQLQAALANRLRDAAPPAHVTAAGWIDSVADALAARVQAHAPEAAP